jgi:hypothetical protein
MALGFLLRCGAEREARRTSGLERESGRTARKELR